MLRNSVPAMATSLNTFRGIELGNVPKLMKKVNVVRPNNARCTDETFVASTSADIPPSTLSQSSATSSNTTSTIAGPSSSTGNLSRTGPSSSTDSLSSAGPSLSILSSAGPSRAGPSSSTGNLSSAGPSLSILSSVGPSSSTGHLSSAGPSSSTGHLYRAGPSSSTGHLSRAGPSSRAYGIVSEGARPKRKYENNVQTESVNLLDSNVRNISVLRVDQNIRKDVSSRVVDAESTRKQFRKMKKGRKGTFIPDPRDLPPDIVEQIPHLPAGWIRHVTVRKSGKTAGLVDIYITNPEGQKFRSMPEIGVYLFSTGRYTTLNINDFSFSRKPYEGYSSTIPQTSANGGRP